MSRRVLILVGFLVICSAGCTTPTTFLGYLEDRRQDLIDSVHVDLSYVNVGVVAYAGPFVLGYDEITSRDEDGLTSVEIGLGGPRLASRTGVAAGVLWPLQWWNEERDFLGLRPKKAPAMFSAGAAVGIVGGLGAEVDVYEIVDFILGLFCLDICGDDEFVEEAP